MRIGTHRSRYSISVLAIILTVTVSGCAGGLFGTKDEKRAYFEQLEQDTLARLTKEHPNTTQELADAVGYAVVEKKVVKGPMIGAGGGAAVVVENAAAKRSYLRVPEIQFGLGWGMRAEKVVIIFQDLEKLRDLADGKWTVSAGAEAAAKVGETGAAGSGSTSDLGTKGYAAYVLTDAGASVTATINLLRAKPYSID